MAYLTWCRPIPFYAALYYTHNLHFLWAAASAEGHSDVAITSARQLAGGVPVDQIANFPPLEDFLTVPVLTLVRFGRFDAVLAEPQPPAELRYATALWHYARGIAYARLGRAAEAEAEQAAFEAIASDPAWEQTVWVEGPLARRLEVARHHLAGELAAARHDSAGAVAELEAAVAGPGPHQLHRAAGLLLPDAPGPRRRAARRGPARRRRGRLPQGPGAVPEERLVALRPQPGAARAEEDGGDALGRAGLRPRVGAIGREAQRVAVLNAKRPGAFSPTGGSRGAAPGATAALKAASWSRTS